MTAQTPSHSRSRARSEAADHPLLEVEDLGTTFFTERETIRAVDGISFSLSHGETVGLVGESGSGKSVTARSIMGLINSPGRITGGSIRFGDPDIVRQLAGEYPGKTIDLDALDAEHGVEELVGQLLDRGVSPLTITGDRSYHDARSGEISATEVVRDGSIDMRTLVEKRFTEQLGLTDEESFVVTERREGENEVGGYVDLTRAPEDALRTVRGNGIAMVFQDPLTSLNPVYTVGNQIEEAVKLHQGLTGRAAREEATRLMEAVSIPDARRRVEEYPHQFSGGMRQRAVIAMALACEPEVLITDEPTTALDVTIQAQILELLRDIQEERDLGILFITHDMGVIAETADRVNVMYAGELVERAPVEELYGAPKHPYTQGLLESIPGRHEREERLRTIEGDVPTPNEKPTYCRFAPRCPEAFADCEVVHPVNVDVSGDRVEEHTAACLLYPEEMNREQAVMYHDSLAPIAESGGLDDSESDENEAGGEQ